MNLSHHNTNIFLKAWQRRSQERNSLNIQYKDANIQGPGNGGAADII